MQKQMAELNENIPIRLQPSELYLNTESAEDNDTISEEPSSTVSSVQKDIKYPLQLSYFDAYPDGDTCCNTICSIM